MRCHNCRSIRHLKFHRECPTEKERRKQGDCVLDGVRYQLKDGVNTAQILSCLASALYDATQGIEDDTTSHASPYKDEIDVKYYHLNQDNPKDFDDQSVSDDELFTANFAERLGHAIEASISHIIDTGAVRSCIGTRQANAYANSLVVGKAYGSLI
eukprot:IDg9761t1